MQLHRILRFLVSQKFYHIITCDEKELQNTVTVLPNHQLARNRRSSRFGGEKIYIEGIIIMFFHRFPFVDTIDGENGLFLP